ncbi:MAG: PAS domain-containing protein, partial [Salinivirgaceae bacterium]|nr:PAS domain-containing protein [Salinivirgaceae bacterium]
MNNYQAIVNAIPKPTLLSTIEGQCLASNKLADILLFESREIPNNTPINTLFSHSINAGILAKAIQTKQNINSIDGIIAVSNATITVNIGVLEETNTRLLWVFEPIKSKLKKSFSESLIESIPNPVFYKDKSGKYTGCNKAFLKLLGQSRSAVVG